MSKLNWDLIHAFYGSPQLSDGASLPSVDTEAFWRKINDNLTIRVHDDGHMDVLRTTVLIPPKEAE